MAEAGCVVFCSAMLRSRQGEAASTLGHLVKLQLPLKSVALTTRPPKGPGGLGRLLGFTLRVMLRVGELDLLGERLGLMDLEGRLERDGERLSLGERVDERVALKEASGAMLGGGVSAADGEGCGGGVPSGLAFEASSSALLPSAPSLPVTLLSSSRAIPLRAPCAGTPLSAAGGGEATVEAAPPAGG